MPSNRLIVTNPHSTADFGASFTPQARNIDALIDALRHAQVGTVVIRGLTEATPQVQRVCAALWDSGLSVELEIED